MAADPPVVTKLLDVVRESGKRPRFTVGKFAATQLTAIPPRKWVYARHYMLGMVTATAGIGGAGKSSLQLIELISIAIGIDLKTGRDLVIGPLAVLYINLEDPMDEILRRVAAIVRRYEIDPEKLEGKLFINSGRDTPLVVAHEMQGGSIIAPTGTGDDLAEEIKGYGIKVVGVDPFVATHQVPENNNAAIDAVMGIWRDIAHRTETAIELAHHLRKTNGSEASIDDVRGASSMIGACRSVRVLAPMSTDDAARYGLADSARRRHIWLQYGKANMAPPPAERDWYQLESVDLGNAAGVYEADQVAVVVPWLPPEQDLQLTQPEYTQVRRAIREIERPLNEARRDRRAKGWLGLVMLRALELDDKEPMNRARVQGLIDRWIKAGRLRVDVMKDPRQARAIEVLIWTENDD